MSDSVSVEIKLTPAQRRAVSALLVARSCREAASIAGVHERTVARWLNRPEFQQAIRDAESELLAATMRRLVGSTARAADALDDSLSDTYPIKVRMRGADILLSRLMALRDLVTLEERVSMLERDNERQKATGKRSGKR